MIKINFKDKFSKVKIKKKYINFVSLAIFAVLFTGILVSKYFFFQTIVGDDNTSKIMVTAPRNIEVIDTIKTENRKREVARKVNVIYSTADDLYIINNLNDIINKINEIRTSNSDYKDKQKILDVMVDVQDVSLKNFVVSYFLNANEELVNKVFASSEKTLTSVLKEDNREGF